MKKRWKMLLVLSAAVGLTMIPATAVQAQTVTIDSEGPEYSGDYLMTVNTNARIDFLKGNSSDTDLGLNESWESTGVPGAAGPSEAAAGTESGASSENKLVPDTQGTSGDSGIVSLGNGDAVTTVYKVGDKREFNSEVYYGAEQGKRVAFTAECIAVTKNCTLWYNACDTLKLQHSKEEITALADQIQTCAETETASFGDSSRIDVDHDGKVAFVFYPMKSASTGGMFDDKVDLEKNGMDMLNMNTRCGSDTELAPLDLELGMAVHEWQHLINYAQTGSMDNIDTSTNEKEAEAQFQTRSYGWLNESFSQSAIELNGLEPGPIQGQIPSADDYIEKYGKALTVPFVFDGIYVPREDPLNPGVYTNWYLFGRYLSAQTEGYEGGGDSIYKTVFDYERDSFTDPNTGEVVENVGKCDDETLEKALTKIGYLGTGDKAKAKSLKDMLCNFVLATYLREDSGIYSLGGYGKFNLASYESASADTVAETPQKLPAGYSGCLTKLDGGSISVDEVSSGADILHWGIKISYDGIAANAADNGDGTVSYTLSTTDTGTKIYYTTDGSIPSASNGTLYDGTPVTVSSGTVVRAVDTDSWGTSDVWSSTDSQRIGGPTRYDTMAALVSKAFPNGSSAAVLASGTNWPDALAASALAGAKGCPVILTDPDEISVQALLQLSSLGTETVYIVGGESAVSLNIDKNLAAKGIAADHIIRLGGADRMQTAERIETEVMKSSSADTVIICSGQDFPDALSVSAYAYAQKMPILLTGNDGRLTDASAAIAGNFKNAILIGQTGAVSEDVRAQLPGINVKRCGGNDRYQTSLQVVGQLYGGNVPLLAVATGDDFPDALAGASFAGSQGGAILLVDNSGIHLNPEQKAIIKGSGSVRILGGEGAVSFSMKQAIDDVRK